MKFKGPKERTRFLLLRNLGLKTHLRGISWPRGAAERSSNDREIEKKRKRREKRERERERERERASEINTDTKR